MEICIAGTVNDSMVDGPGLRYAVFTQGCPHACPGCHNPETHDYKGGETRDTQSIIDAFRKNPLLDGLTLSGGEPFEQPLACALLAEAARQSGLNVWAYSGYTWQELQDQPDADTQRLLQSLDVLVDGRFEMNKRSLDLMYCGSTNQRLIDVQQSLKAGEARIWTPPAW